MDVISRLTYSGGKPVTCIEMHTTGEPTRIVISGFPRLTGTLLEQRAKALADHDHIRKRLMLEPAGHADMYGAILRQQTELTESGEAHIGVLFMHNEGYSTMCGHATIALGRFLVDTHDLSVFPLRGGISVDLQTRTAEVRLHAPCGLIKVMVPVNEGGTSSDPTRPVSFVSVPSFSTGANVRIDIPLNERWPELGQRASLTASFCYGGAFTCLVSAQELGFKNGLHAPLDHEALDKATRRLKNSVNGNPTYERYLKHPEEKDLSSLYTVMVTDSHLGIAAPSTNGAETGLCFFADQQIDRSPTGSAVAARVAHACATGNLRMREPWTYHSLVSNAAAGQGGFVGSAVEEVSDYRDADTMISVPVRVRVEGYAFYIGSHTFVVEKDDPLADEGFLFGRLGS